MAACCRSVGAPSTPAMDRMGLNKDPDRYQLADDLAKGALENIANSDALYHNVEHTILVTIVGQEITGSTKDDLELLSDETITATSAWGKVFGASTGKDFLKTHHDSDAATETRTTTFTLPGSDLTELSSTLATVAPTDGGRTTRP